MSHAFHVVFVVAIGCWKPNGTCPSGVRYGNLVDIGRAVVEARTQRPAFDRFKRALLSFGVPRTRLFTAALRLGQLFNLAPKTSRAGAWPAARQRCS